MRYSNFRQCLLLLLSYLSGTKNVVFIDDIKDILLCEKVLTNSNKKGYGIEYHLSMSAWEPIYNIESIDGEKWKCVRKYFHIIASKIDLCKLKNRSHQFASEMVKYGKNITSKDISKLICKIFWFTIFDENIDSDNLEILYKGSIEWRKELAVKGKGDYIIKENCVNIIESTIFRNQLLSDIKDDYDQYRKEIISSILQPFFISPMINYSDIFVTIYDYKKYFPHNGFNEIDAENFIMECIRLKHPFPILERMITTSFFHNDIKYNKGTQVYIELDRFKQDKLFKPNRWNNRNNIYKNIPFGIGYRRCLGKNFALKSIIPILIELSKSDEFLDINPKIEHLYSGRDNDNKLSLSEILYFMGTIFQKLYHCEIHE